MICSKEESLNVQVERCTRAQWGAANDPCGRPIDQKQKKKKKHPSSGKKVIAINSRKLGR